MKATLIILMVMILFFVFLLYVAIVEPFYTRHKEESQKKWKLSYGGWGTEEIGGVESYYFRWFSTKEQALAFFSERVRGKYIFVDLTDIDTGEKERLVDNPYFADVPAPRLVPTRSMCEFNRDVGRPVYSWVCAECGHYHDVLLNNCGSLEQQHMLPVCEEDKKAFWVGGYSIKVCSSCHTYNKIDETKYIKWILGRYKMGGSDGSC